MKTRILMTAYAVNPYKGSEDGTGWNYIAQAARFTPVIAITRKNNRENIEKYLWENIKPEFENIKFYYFDLPYWLRFWKKGTIGALVYFYLWQLTIPFFILRKRIVFDIAHNLNFHNDWIPTFLWVFGKPLIWGPVGHHPPIPVNYIIKTYGYKALIIDRANYFIKTIVRRMDPFIYISLWKSKVILSVNSTTAQKYPWVKDKIRVFPAIGGVKILLEREITKIEKFTVFSAGRFEPIKGFDMAINAYNKFCEKLSEEEKPLVEFLIAGSGKYKSVLSDIAAKGILSESIHFLSWVPKEKIGDLYNTSSVFLFPSYEGAGMVIPEALSYGIPIICFNNPGPGESTDRFSALTVEYTTYEKSVEELSNHLYTLFKNKQLRASMSTASKDRFSKLFDWDQKGELLNTIYKEITLRK